MTTIFLRNFSCLTQILKSCQKASTSKINFSKSQTLWTGTYKNKIVQPRQMVLVAIFHENSCSAFWFDNRILFMITGTETKYITI